MHNDAAGFVCGIRCPTRNPMMMCCRLQCSLDDNRVFLTRDTKARPKVKDVVFGRVLQEYPIFQYPIYGIRHKTTRGFLRPKTECKRVNLCVSDSRLWSITTGNVSSQLAHQLTIMMFITKFLLARSCVLSLLDK